MSDRRNTSSVLKMRLSILFREAHDLELQLFELNELRYRVSQAELLARKSRCAGGSGPAPRRSATGEGVAHIGRSLAVRQA
jgi:hypothetical protein